MSFVIIHVYDLQRCYVDVYCIVTSTVAVNRLSIYTSAVNVLDDRRLNGVTCTCVSINLFHSHSHSHKYLRSDVVLYMKFATIISTL